jgi:hypothetical protein
MDSCGNVRMDRYWNFVALPFFIVTLLFGLFALFRADEQQFAPTPKIRSGIENLKLSLGQTKR